ncbi:MAG: lipopolysaccharide biosynthesis protein [Bryobacteraceae bacterium]|nr:lipopolysaccharide biosynthesis protein [Bryobacteraceae bacterium]
MSAIVREVSGDTASVFLAEAVAVPAGLLIVALLSRNLGPAGYGRYGIAVAVVGIAEWLVASAFARISVILLSDPAMRDQMEPSVLRHYLVTALAVAVLLFVGADLLATLLQAKYLSSDLRWLCVDVPLFALTNAQRSIVTARGEYSGRALAIVVRWISRLTLTAAFVFWGLGVLGALLAWPASSLAELFCFRRISWSFLWKADTSPVSIWRECRGPFVFATGQRLMERADLLVLQAYGTSASFIGYYVAGQNLSILPGLFAASLAPVLTAAMTRERVLGREEASRNAGALSMKASLYMLPLAPVFGSCGQEIAALAFGPQFLQAGPLTGWLVAGFVGVALASAAASIVSAERRFHLMPWLSVPGAITAFALQAAIVPVGGMTRAAMVSAFVGLGSGLVATVIVYRNWGQAFPVIMIGRVAGATLAVLGASQFWVIPALAWPYRAALLLMIGVVSLLVAGEWRLLASKRQSGAVS